MTCRVGGNPISCGLLMFREMNFGQPVPDLETVSYEVSLPASEYVSALEGHYREYADDDKQYGDEFVEEPVLELRQLGWPSLAEVAARHPRLFEPFVLHCQAYHALHELFPVAGPAVEPRFIINSVDAVTLNGDIVSLTGIAIKR